MEGLPDDVMCKVLSCLTDTRSLAHFALASRRCNDMVIRAELVCNFSVGCIRHDLNPTIPPGFKHCVSCIFCKTIIPVPKEPVVMEHQCVNHSHPHFVFSDRNVIMYRGSTDHMPQPTLFSAVGQNKGVIVRAPRVVFNF